jgi:hypothetical protein
MSVTHAHVSAIADDPTKDVSSSEWNDAHAGTIDDAMHGSRGSSLHSDSHAASHAHNGVDGSGAVALLSGQLNPGSVTIATESFVVHRDHLKLSSTGRLTQQGTSRFYLRDVGENAYGVQGEIAPVGNIILGVPKTPALSFTIPTEYQHQILGRLGLAVATRANLVGTADLYIENDAPRGGRIVISGRG